MNLRRHVVTGLVVLGLIGSGGGATLAWSHGSSGHEGGDHGSAAKDEYKPGKGCGDKNHKHKRHDECKKHDHGDNGDNGDNGGGDNGDHGGGDH